MNHCRCIRVLLVLYPLVFSVGCASTDVVHERGWVGGSYVEANPSILKRDYFTDPPGTLHALPDEVRKRQSGALLVTRVFEDTPLATADVREGDLILAVNHIVVENVKSLKRVINDLTPGSTVPLVLYRDGKVIERPVTTGIESFKRQKTLEIGFGFGFDLDLIPNPDFSVFSLISYRRHANLVERRSPEWKFLAATNSPNPHDGLTTAVSDESPVFLQTWKFWFVIFGFGVQEAILTQEPARSTDSHVQKGTTE